MKRNGKKNAAWTVWVLSILLLSGIILGCATTAGKPVESGETAEPAREEQREEQTQEAAVESAWIIDVIGIGSNTMSEADLLDSKGHASHYVERVIEKKGEEQSYRGIPLRLLLAMVDGPDNKHPYIFDEEKWNEGYEVTITASDGYSATFLSSDFDPEEMIVADEENGNPILPQLAGDMPGNLWVKDIVSIEADLGDAAAEEPFTLEVDIAGIEKEYTLDELEASPWYTEGTGSYTTSAGTTHTHTYGGIRFADFVNSFTQLEPDTTVTMVAMDGYEMTYSGEQILDTSDGEWILAFKIDGEYMEFDPGYIRTVKIGPENPNIEGHLSVRMIKAIRATGEKFEDFTLALRGKQNWDLDRQTIQSGVSCHKTTVTYYDRKADADEEYSGIPLHLLLAYADDPNYAPHHQDKSILSYNKEAAREGYGIKITAADGFSITLDSKEVHGNGDVIIALFKNGAPLPEQERPLIIVWDKDAETVPAGIKAVRNITEIELLF